MIKKIAIIVLLKIKSLFRLIGIDIAFVKKEVKIESIQWNTLESTDKIYASQDYKNIIFSKEHQLFFHQIMDLIDKKGIQINDKVVADFGCGIGNLIFHLNKTHQPISSYGFDFSSEAIELAKKRVPYGHFQVHDIYTEPEMKFDVIFCTETLEHLLYPDIALKNLQTSLNEKGFLLITVPDGRKDTFAGHINFWSLESWTFFIEKNCLNNKFETGFINKNNLFAVIKKQ